MDLNDWLTFRHVVDLGGLSQAGRRLGLPKSTLSRRLKKLEEEVGARLINRRGRSFSLTDAGRLFYDEACRLAVQVDTARDRIAEQIGRESGAIRMTAPKTPGERFLGAWLARFLQAHPDIQIELDLDDHVVSLPEKGYDLALRVGSMADSPLVARPLGRSDRLLVASPSFIAQRGQPASPDQLPALPCITYGEQRDGRGTWTLTQGRRSTAVTFRPALRCDDMATILSACIGGAGVALIPAFICRQALDAGMLKRVLPDWFGPPALFNLVYVERRLLPKHVRLLVDFLIHTARSEGPRVFG